MFAAADRQCCRVEHVNVPVPGQCVLCRAVCRVRDGAFAGESVACGMPCGHMPNLYLTSHLTPRLAVSVRRVFVSSRVMLSRASRTYVLCRGVWCAVCPQRCAFRAAGAWDALWARTICHGM